MADTTTDGQDIARSITLGIQAISSKEPVPIRHIDQSLVNYCLNQNSSIAIVYKDSLASIDDPAVAASSNNSVSHETTSEQGPSHIVTLDQEPTDFSVNQELLFTNTSDLSHATVGHQGSHIFNNRELQSTNVVYRSPPAGVDQTFVIDNFRQRSPVNHTNQTLSFSVLNQGSSGNPTNRGLLVSPSGQSSSVLNQKAGFIPWPRRVSPVDHSKKVCDQGAPPLNKGITICSPIRPCGVPLITLDEKSSQNLDHPEGLPTLPKTLSSSLRKFKLIKMQEQQQQHLKTMIGTNGHLAYYGLHLPQQPLNVIGTEGGFCPTNNTGTQNCLIPVGPSLHSPAQTSTQPSSTMSSLINYLNVSSTSKSTMSSSVSISPIVSTSPNFVPNNANTTSANSSVIDNVSNSILSTTATGDKSLCKTTESDKANGSVGSIVGNVSSSTSKASNVEKISDQEFQNQKSPLPTNPNRMVTRSQTAAERMQPMSDEGEQMKDDHRALKHARAPGSDFEDDYSPHKVKREMMSTSGVVFDDFSYVKNPAGAGIEFGAVCADCGAVAVTGVGWNAHQQAHRNEGTSCIYCNQVFLTDHGRQIHQQLHREGQTRDVDDFCECGICGGSFISIVYLELHLLELHGREVLCEQRALHLGPSSNTDPSCPPEDESGRQLFRCGVCKSLFTFSLNLDCHMALHSEVSYCCALCDAAFPTLDPLVTHSKGHRYAGHAAAPSSVPMHMTPAPIPTRPQQCTVFQPMANTSFNAWKPHPVRNAFHPRPMPPPTTTKGFVNPTMNTQVSYPGPSKAIHPSTVSVATSGPSSVSNVMTTSGTPPVTPTVMTPMPPVMSPLVSPMNPIMAPSMAPAVTPVMTAPMTPAMLNYYMMMTLWGGNKSCGNQGSIPVWQNYMNPAMANVFNYFNPYLLNNPNMINNSSNNNENNGSSQNPYCFKPGVNKESDPEFSGNAVGKVEDGMFEESKG